MTAGSGRTILILSDSLFAGTVLVMAYSDGGFNSNPPFLNLLVVVAFATCIIRHINYYKHNKRIY